MPKTVLYERIIEHLRGTGVQLNYSEAFASKVCSWNNTLGPEMAVKAIKELKLLFTSQYSNTGPSFEGMEVLEVEKGNERSVLKDTFLDYLVFSYGPKYPEKFRAMVDVQYMFTLAKVTEAGKDKFQTALATEPLELSNDLVVYSTLAVEWFKEYASKRYPSYWETNDDNITLRGLDYSSRYQKYLMMMTSSKRSPVFRVESSRMKTTPRSSLRTLEWLPLWTHDRDLYKFWSCHESKVNSILLGTNHTGLIPESNPTADVPLGTVAVILEKGNKERWICNPHLSLQMVTEPIKSALLDVSRQVPWVYTTNQDKAHARLCSLYRKGKMELMHCFDASNFTDTFSFDLQLYVVKNLFREEDWPYIRDALELVAKKSYYSSNHQKSVAWKSGQPLGTGPSFHLACFTHAMIAFASAIKLHLSKKGFKPGSVKNELLDADGNTVKASTVRHLKKSIIHQTTLRFGVVGDDGFCFGSDYAPDYLALLADANLQINESKSIVSASLYEFCGKWIINGRLIKSTKPPRCYEKAAQVLSAITDYGLQYYTSLRDEIILQFDLESSVQLPRKLGGLDLLLPNVRSAISVDIGKLLQLKVVESVTFVNVPITTQSYSNAVRVDQRARAHKVRLFFTRCAKYLDINDVSKAYKPVDDSLYNTGSVSIVSEWSKLPMLIPSMESQNSQNEGGVIYDLPPSGQSSELKPTYKELIKFQTRLRVIPNIYRLLDQMYRFSNQLDPGTIKSLIHDGYLIEKYQLASKSGETRTNPLHLRALSLDKRSPFEEITYVSKRGQNSHDRRELETGPSRYFRRKVRNFGEINLKEEEV